MLADQPHGRRLTDAERLVLADLERRLDQDDPRLSTTLRRPHRYRAPAGWARTEVAVVLAVAAALLVVAGAVGGLGGAAAVAVTLVATCGVLWLARRRMRRRSR